jgi:hypothetical protein
MSAEDGAKAEESGVTQEMISASMPDTSAVMEKVSYCWWHLIYAARGGNWGLARHYTARVRKLMDMVKVFSPQHAERADTFLQMSLPAVVAATNNEDLDRLEEAYDAATDVANHLHADSGHPFIKWTLPAEPPKGLQFDPVQADAEEGAHR